MTSVWQVSAGPANRRYAEVFLRYGVALIGPGDTGPWSTGRDDEEFEGSYVRRFTTEVQSGDAIVLRVGTSRICAIGLVAGDYQHLPQFEDINGWDLSHARRVRWRALPEDYDFGTAVFGAQSQRFSRVGLEKVTDFVERFLKSPPIDWQRASLPSLPDIAPAMEEPPAALRDIVAQLHDLHGLYWDEGRFGDRPREDELIVHYVVPLMRALGWSVEHIAIKWRDVDVTLFRSLPRIPENVYLIIEAKRLGQGVEGALDQAKGYLEALEISRNVVVTDGARYRLYDSRNEFAPLAYANLLNLKRPAEKFFELIRRP